MCVCVCVCVCIEGMHAVFLHEQFPKSDDQPGYKYPELLVGLRQILNTCRYCK